MAGRPVSLESRIVKPDLKLLALSVGSNVLGGPGEQYMPRFGDPRAPVAGEAGR